MAASTSTSTSVMDSPAASPIIIPIHTSYSEDTPPEWAMIEINGELILPSLRVDEEDDNDDNMEEDDGTRLVSRQHLELGSIRWEGDKPLMILGSHELTGKSETLKQPFCVLQKITDELHPNNNNAAVSYKVKGIVTRKILFNQYPKVIMRAVQS